MPYRLFGTGLRFAILILALTMTNAMSEPSDLHLVLNQGHTEQIYAVALSPDGHTLATGGLDGVRIWDVQTGRELFTFRETGKCIGWVQQIVWVADGRRLRVSSADSANARTYCFVDIMSGATSPQQGEVLSLLSNDGKWSLSWRDGSGDPIDTARLSDVETGLVHAELKGHTGKIRAAAFSPDGTRIVTAGTDGSARLWDVPSGRQLREIVGLPIAVLETFTGAVSPIVLSADNRFVLAVGEDGHAGLWNIDTGTEISRFEVGMAVSCVILSPDGATAIFAGDGIDVWDVTNARLKRHLEVKDVDIGIRALAVSSDGNRIVVAGESEDLHMALMLDLDSGRKLQRFGGHVVHANSAVYSSDMKLILTGTSNGSWLWDASTGTLLRELVRPSFVGSVSVSQDSKVALTGGLESTSLWDVSTGREVGKFANDAMVTAFSPDGRIMLIGVDRAAILVEVGTGHEISRFSFHDDIHVNSVAFSPNGRFALVCSGATVGVFDLFTHAENQRLSFEDDWVSTVATFSADSRSVIIGREDGTLRFLDIELKSIPRQFSTTGAVRSLAVSPDGRFLLSGQSDGIARLWDVSTGAEIRQFKGHRSQVFSASFSPDSRRIVTSSADGAFGIWDVETGDQLVEMIEFDDLEWITITPEGFFNASEHGASLLHVVRGFSTFGIDQFYQSLYRPDLVREKLAGDPRGLVQAAAAQLDLGKVIASGNAPDVRVTIPGRSLSTAPLGVETLIVQADITDRGGGIGRIEWRVNKVTVGVDAPAPGAISPLVLTRSIALEPGPNAIEVTAYNSANLLASVPGQLDVVAAQPVAPSVPPSQAPGAVTAPAPEQTSTKPRLFVLVAGVNKYADERINLTYAVADATDVGRALQTAGQPLYRAVEVVPLTDEEVVSDKLDAAFRRIANEAKASDTFAVYFAGHGITIDGRYYFAPQNLVIDGKQTSENVARAVKSAGITQEQLQRWFASIPARKGIILFDTCDSGTLAGDAGVTQSLERDAANDRLAQSTGRSIITAAASAQDANEGYHGHGLFTYELLDAINRADSDRNGTIEVNELAAYVNAQVRQISLKFFNKPQEPHMKLAANYALAKQMRILQDEAVPIAETKPTHRVSKTAKLQVKGGPGATVVRSLSAATAVTVLESRDGWSLVATDGEPIGYVATRDLAPAP